MSKSDSDLQCVQMYQADTISKPHDEHQAS